MAEAELPPPMAPDRAAELGATPLTPEVRNILAQVNSNAAKKAAAPPEVPQKAFQEAPGGQVVEGASATAQIPGEPSASLRGVYATALINGTTKGPADFTEAYKAQAAQVHAEADIPPDKGPLANTPDPSRLPTHADLVDHAIASLRIAGYDVTPDNIAIAKQNLATNWAQTGASPADQFDAATRNPAVLNTVVKARPAAQTVNETDLGIFKALEAAGHGRPTASVIDTAESMTGKNATQNRGEIESFLAKGGYGIDVSKTAWCAAFVNSSLEQAGMHGSGALTARSFDTWGQPLVNPLQTKAGDVLVMGRGQGPESGPLGHVGLATGEMRRNSDGQLELEMISGNTTNHGVAHGWVLASNMNIRRQGIGGAIAPQANDFGAKTQIPGVGQETLATFRALEGTPGGEMSSAGAVGPYQIVPKDFPQFDANRLANDPSYNEFAAKIILQNLSDRYHGDMRAMAIAYNAGPSRADKWLAAGRDDSVLPAETQKYVAHLDRIHPDMAALKQPGRDRIFDPTAEVPVTAASEELAKGPVGAVVQKATDYFEDLATKDYQDIKNLSWSDLVDGFKSFGDEANKAAESDEAKKPLAERVKNPQDMDTAISLAIGGMVGPIEAAGTKLFNLINPNLKRAAKDFESARGLITEQNGVAYRDKVKMDAAVEKQRADFNKVAAPAYRQYLVDVQNSPLGAAVPKPPAIQLLDHIEGMPGAAISPTSSMFATATVLKSTYEFLKTEIEKSGSDVSGYVQDYFKHQFDLPTSLAGANHPLVAPGIARQTVPTIGQALATGLKPVNSDMLDMTLQHMQGMRDYLNSRDILEIAEGNGQVIRGPAGIPPSPGWQRLNGASAMRNGEPAWAPPGFAKAYNRNVGRGWHDWGNGTTGKVMDKLQKASSLFIAAKLSISAFHAWNIAQESAVATLSRAIGNVEHGELAQGLANIGKVPVAPFLAERAGKKLQEQYLRTADYGPDMEHLADLYARSGGRLAKNRGPEYGGALNTDFWRSWREGSLGQDFKNEVLKIPESKYGPLGNALVAGGRALEFGGDLVNNIGRLPMRYLFDNAIPRIKASAWSDEMSDWMARNPLATREAQVTQGRVIQRSMDDRFGEMVQDNLFWPKALKQALNLVTVSVGWEYGSLRAYGGALKDIANFDWRSPRARWLTAFPLLMAMQSQAYQYVMGQGNLQDLHDAIAPRSGGTYHVGKGATVPERALLPGYEKDALQWYNATVNAPDYATMLRAPYNIASQKLNPATQTIQGLATGKQWAGYNIAGAFPNAGSTRQTPDLPSEWTAYMRFIGDQLTPISQEPSGLKQGSKLNTTQKLLGIRQAPSFVQDPETYQKGVDYRHEKDLKDSNTFSVMMKERAEGTEAPAAKEAKPRTIPQQQAVQRRVEKKAEAKAATTAASPGIDYGSAGLKQ